MDEDLKGLLEQLAAKLGTTGTELFAALTENMRVEGITEIVVGVVSFAAAIGCGLFAMHYLGTVPVESNPYGEIIYDAFWAGAGRLLALGGMIAWAIYAAYRVRYGFVQATAPEGEALAWLLRGGK